MFDNLVAAHGPNPRGRARTIVITTSVIVHAAAVAVLAIWAMWRIDKLDVEAPGTRVNAFILPRDSGGGGRPKVELRARQVEEKVVKVKPAVVVQPEKEVPKERIVTEAEVDGATALGTDGTAPGNGMGGDGKGAGKPDGPPCEGVKCLGGGTGGGGDEEKKLVCAKGETLIDGKCVKEKKVEVISPDVAKGLRKSGNDQIPAPTSVRTQMMRASKTKAVGTLKLCLDARGRVERVQVLKSTGYDEYDELLQKEMRAWRYEPYKVDGEGVPACTVVTIVYVMK